ncbi:TenA family protein [Halomicroarcula sp. F28]|uniref:TenA family protein n=1 Tax=Haloarcula salinisoli TaxID=2487746 RepID=UPI001C72F573|nr:TenA family protein [Halomicroarcula salinisoli]MBX0287099.1 TenA family protein [Halomicroarcula salinisoli]
MSTDSDAPAAVPATYADYASDRTEPRFTDWLRARSGDAWDDATAHEFAHELHADTLDDVVFRRYLLQDYAFVETLVGVFGYAVGDAPTMAAKSRLVEFLGTVTSEENDYFQRSFEALDVPESRYSDPQLAEPTAAFRDCLLRAAREGGYAETLAVLVPAEWVYLSWATDGELATADGPDRFYLQEWIDLHAVPEFESFVNWLRTELDREGAAASERRQARLAELFCRTVDLEVAFFDAAYDGKHSRETLGDDR